MKWNSHLIHLTPAHNLLGGFLSPSLSCLHSWPAGLDILLFLRVTCHAVRNSVHLSYVQPQTLSFTTWTTRTAGAKRGERKRRTEIQSEEGGGERAKAKLASEKWGETVFVFTCMSTNSNRMWPLRRESSKECHKAAGGTWTSLWRWERRTKDEWCPDLTVTLDFQDHAGFLWAGHRGGSVSAVL